MHLPLFLRPLLSRTTAHRAECIALSTFQCANDSSAAGTPVGDVGVRIILGGVRCDVWCGAGRHLMCDCMSGPTRAHTCVVPARRSNHSQHHHKYSIMACVSPCRALLATTHRDVAVDRRFRMPMPDDGWAAARHAVVRDAGDATAARVKQQNGANAGQHHDVWHVLRVRMQSRAPAVDKHRVRRIVDARHVAADAHPRQGGTGFGE